MRTRHMSPPGLCCQVGLATVNFRVVRDPTGALNDARNIGEWCATSGGYPPTYAESALFS